ncbi:single-strand DNA-binding protein [Ruminiclostridium sufflavum DSM 19573]|uniref:Single-stranded DNA-binding protein n=1 Tax=Ruminiclostridium sufflavum DSM 19573 TaxID=1121337 RepID=A0A318Y7Y8_9FIRM|nr:single-stranded DNA-binding protein [Ruminiclostridium sufflavum]PYG88264.1 single-strand DNA-binding protein [Ruminiclostridium sufflavum DSM 19573]
MNNVSLVGRLTKDVELRYTAKNSKAVGAFILAVGREIKKTAQNKTTDFIPIVTWGKTAEFASKYFAKGNRIALQGSIHTRMWEDEQKNKHYVTEVIANRVFFADSKQKVQDADNANEALNENPADELFNEMTDEEKADEEQIT